MRTTASIHAALLLIIPWLASAQNGDALATKVLAESGVTGGFCLFIGTTDGVTEAAIAQSGAIYVHGLALSDETARGVRESLSDDGLYGLVTVDRWSGRPRVPLVDGLANLVVMDRDALGPDAASDAEIRRVLCLGGSAFVKSGGTWTKTTGQAVPGTAELAMWDVTAGGNPVSTDSLVGLPHSVRWISGRSQSGTGDGPRIVDGKLIAKYDECFSPTSMCETRNTRDIKIHARDAYNGIMLWKKNTDFLTRYRSFTMFDGKIFGYNDSRQLVALDAKTGSAAGGFPAAGLQSVPDALGRYHHSHYNNVVPYNGLLYVSADDSVTCVDPTTGAARWRHVGEGTELVYAVVGDGKVFVAYHGSGFWPKGVYNGTHFAPSKVVCLNAADGARLWESAPIAEDLRIVNIPYADGVVALAGKSENSPANGLKSPTYVYAINASDGTTRWKRVAPFQDRDPKDMTDFNSIAIADGAVWLMDGGCGFKLDLVTGATIGVYRHKNMNCTYNRMTANWVVTGHAMASKSDFNNSIGWSWQHSGACRTGGFPANGLLYTEPPKCGCSNFLRCWVASSSDSVDTPVDDARRLEKGTDVAALKTGQWPAPAEWPMFLRDPERTSYAPSPMPGTVTQLFARAVASYPTQQGPIVTDWMEYEQCQSLISSPVVAESLVVMALPSYNRVVAYGAFDAQPRWAFTAGGRVDSPPVIYKGLVLFGCRDGWVYSLRASDGALVWRFLAAVNDQRIMAGAQLESSWPVFGALMIADGALLVNAGRHTQVDGGIQIWKLDPRTGALLGKSVYARPLTVGSNGLNDILVSDGTNLHISFQGYLTPTDLNVKEVPFGWYKSGNVADQLLYYASTSGPLIQASSLGHDLTGYNACYATYMARGTTALYTGSHIGPSPEKMGGGPAFFNDIAKLLLGPDGKIVSGPENTIWRKNEHKAYLMGLAASAAAEGIDGKVFVVSGINTPKLHIVNEVDGTYLQALPLPGAVTKRGIAVAYGRVYVTTWDGQLVCFGPEDQTPPSKVTGVSATPLTSTAVGLSWNVAVDNESGVATYLVYRNDSYVGKATGTSFTDSGLVERTAYGYRVAAVNGCAIAGEKSDPVSATTLADGVGPRVQTVLAFGSAEKVTVVFDEPVEKASAETAANYSIDNGVSVLAAALSDDRTAVLTVSALSEKTTYTLTSQSIRDRAVAPNQMSAPQQKEFTYISSLSGVLYDYYEGSWGRVPDLSILTPVSSGTAPNFDISVAQRGDNFVVNFSGLIDIPTAGTYTFYTKSDDGSVLFIDGAKVVDNDGMHGTREDSGTVDLTKGRHEITVTFLEGAGGQTLVVSMQGPGITKQPVPGTMLWYIPRGPVSVASRNDFWLRTQLFGRETVEGFADAPENFGGRPYNHSVRALVNHEPAAQVPANTRVATQPVRSHDETLPCAVAHDDLLPGLSTPLAGTIREYWAGLSGSRIADLVEDDYYPSSPSAIETHAGLDIAAASHNYGERIRTIVTAPASDTYRFRLDSDGEAQLWISENLSGRARRLVAHTGGDDGEVSRAIALTEGRKYFVEILHKAGSPATGLRTSWTRASDGSLAAVPAALLEQPHH